jgi:hypothetical protein
MRRTVGTLVAGSMAVLAGLGLSACGSSGTPSATTGVSTTTARAPTSTTASTTTTAPTTTTAATAVCGGSALTMAAAGASAAAGTQEITFSLANASSMACTMRGYPGMQLLSSAGSDLPTTVDRGGGLSFENVGVSAVTLAPGQVAYFNLGFSDVVAEPPACSSATAAEITPPTATTHGQVSGLTIEACANGTLHVSPVFGGTDTAATATTAPHA